MNSQRVLILGAGISGLSLAWYLSRKQPGSQISILEKNPRAGGWIQTDHTTGFHFEKGPRAFMAKKSRSTLQLVDELQLSQEVIWTESSQHHRYLWFQEKLHPLPRSPMGFLLSPLTRSLIIPLLFEWSRSPKIGDETVWDFAARRFGRQAADRLFDPLVVGIFGGDARRISIKACFPLLKKWEEQNGSVTRGMLHALRERKGKSRVSEHIPEMPLSAFFSFRRGMGALIDALVERVSAEIHYDQQVSSVQFDGKSWKVHAQDRTWEADAIVSALPAAETARLFQPIVPELSQALFEIESQGFTLINAGYRKHVLPIEGFGYLTQRAAHESVLGAVFDSSVFPEHNHLAEETRITMKLADHGSSEKEAVELGLAGIKKHMGLDAVPDVLSFTRAERAIPQYGLNHLERMALVQEKLAQRLPSCRWVGNYLSGVAVDQCIARAKQVVDAWDPFSGVK